MIIRLSSAKLVVSLHVSFSHHDLILFSGCILFTEIGRIICISFHITILILFPDYIVFNWQHHKFDFVSLMVLHFIVSMHVPFGKAILVLFSDGIVF